MRTWKMLLCCVLCAACLIGCTPAASESAPREDFTTVPAQPPQVQPIEGPLDYRAMWFGYPDWPQLDCSSEAAFTASVGTVLDNCVSLGLNGVVVHIRPFGDAIYSSEYFPWSHLLTGTQGQDPGYDPMEIFVAQAHTRGLSFEAWINPYRLRLNEKTPSVLAENGMATQYPEWVKEAAGGLYLDPANAAVQDYIVASVEEVLDRYAVDGIHFDDYFYPTQDESFDAQEYAAQGGGLSLSEWRRQNVNTMVQKVYTAIKAKSPDVTFGISPQGNNDNNYNGKYSDVGLWLSTPGYVDYVMPQVYWGYNFTLQNGSDRFGFDNIVNEWMAMPRCEEVSLMFGLGAYRIGTGDGSSTQSDEWSSGRNVADMLSTLGEKGSTGYGLYSYQHLFGNSEYTDLAASECNAIKAQNGVVQ